MYKIHSNTRIFLFAIMLCGLQAFTESYEPSTWVIDDLNQLKSLVPDAESLFKTIDPSSPKYNEAVVADVAKNLNFGGVPIYKVPVYSERRRSLDQEIVSGNLMVFPGVCASVNRPNEYHARMLVLGQKGKNLAALIVSTVFNVKNKNSPERGYDYTLDPTQPNIVSQNSRTYSVYSRLDPDSDVANFLPPSEVRKYENADQFLKTVEKGLTFWKNMPDKDELFGAIGALSGINDTQRENVIDHLNEYNKQMYLSYGYQFASDEPGSQWNLNFRVGHKSSYTSTGQIINKVDSSREEDELTAYMSDKRNLKLDQYVSIITASRFLRESCYFFTVNNKNNDKIALGMASPPPIATYPGNGTYDLVDHLKYLINPIEEPREEVSHYSGTNDSKDEGNRNNTGSTFNMNGGVYFDFSKKYLILQNGILNGISIDSNNRR